MLFLIRVNGTIHLLRHIKEAHNKQNKQTINSFDIFEMYDDSCFGRYILFISGLCLSPRKTSSCLNTAPSRAKFNTHTQTVRLNIFPTYLSDRNNGFFMLPKNSILIYRLCKCFFLVTFHIAISLAD